MAGAPVEVRSLEDVQAGVQASHAMARAQHLPPLPINFQLRRDAPLSSCAALKARVRAGSSIHRLLNQELLDIKFVAYLSIQGAYERMIREGTEDAIRHIDDITERLNSLVRKQSLYLDGPPQVINSSTLIQSTTSNPAMVA